MLHNMREMSRFILTATVLALPMSALADAGVTLQQKAGAPLVGLTAQELALFETGKLLFATPPTVEEGLGPIFNKSNCQSCHTVPTGGWGSITVTRFGMDEKGEFVDYPGEVQSLLQAEAISDSCKEHLPTDASVTTLRVTNSSLAFGIVESIADADIAANADASDADGDGISGRVHWVEALEDPTGPLRAGRFGWKAQVATVLSFSGDATANEMGFTNALVPNETPPNGNWDLLAQCDQVSDPEDVADKEGFTFIQRVTHFQRFLGMPPQTPKFGMSGETLFNEIGCAQCHIRDWQTISDPSLEDALRDKSARIYSDFLLHDMGTLADGIQQGDANETELRTPTLWNLATRDPMLHDGRVAGGTFENRVTAAIVAHGPFGEGAASAANFAALTPEQQARVVAFLRSLGRLEFDADFSNAIDLVDYLDIRACLGQEVTPDASCAIHDIDQSGLVDSADVALFAQAFGFTDCNNNGTSDVVEILTGAAADANNDAIPDSCQACPSDLSGDGLVGGADLTLLLSGWGTASGDVTGDGSTNGQDLGALLGAWGNCN